MPKMLTILLFIGLFAVSAFGQLNIRQMDFINDQQQNAQQSKVMEWYKGESVRYNIFLVRDNETISIPEGITPIWKIWRTNDLNTLYMIVTGTVVSASGGQIRFDASPTEANLPTGGTYQSAAQLWQGTNYMGVAGYGQARIYWSPAGDSIPYVGTVTYIGNAITGAVAGANIAIARTGNVIYITGGAGSITGAITTGSSLLRVTNAPGQVTLNLNLDSSISTSGQWNAQIQGASNLALAAYALASNSVAGVTDATARAWAIAASNLAAAAVSQVGTASNALNIAITNESALRILADAALSNLVNAVDTTNVQARLASNVWAAADSTTNYQSRVAQTTSNAAMAAQSIAIYAALTNEITSRANGDIANSSTISAETAARQASDVALTNVIGAQGTAQIAADAALSNRVAALDGGSNDLRVALGLQTTNRINADSALSNLWAVTSVDSSSRVSQTQINAASNFFFALYGMAATNNNVESNATVALYGLAATNNNVESNATVALFGLVSTNLVTASNALNAANGLVSTNLSGVSNRLSIAESNYVGRSGVQTMQGPLNVASNIYAVANLGSELVNDGGFAIGGGTTSTTYRLTGGAQWNNSGASEGILILDGTSGTFSQTGQINHVIGPTYSNGIDVANAWTGSLSIADGGETITFALTTTGHLSWLSSYRVVSNAVFTMSSTNGTGKLDNYTSKRFTVGDGYFVNLHAENITATNITGAGAFLVANDITNKVNKTGDTMTGPLTNRASVWASEFRVLGNSYGDTNSFAEGRSNSVQSGPEILGAFARGLKNTARGDFAFVDGYENFSDSDVSFISGACYGSTNHGLNSVILGGGGLNLIQSNTAAGLIFGDHNTIYDSSEFAFAWGEDVQVSGDHAVAIGRACQSLASRSFTMGNNARTTNGGAFVFKDSSEGFVNSESNDQITIVFTNGLRIISGTNVTRLGGPVPTVNGNAISGGGSSLGLFSNATAIAGGITNIHLNGSFTASATGQEAWVNFVDTTGAGGGSGNPALVNWVQAKRTNSIVYTNSVLTPMKWDTETDWSGSFDPATGIYTCSTTGLLHWTVYIVEVTPDATADFYPQINGLSWTNQLPNFPPYVRKQDFYAAAYAIPSFDFLIPVLTSTQTVSISCMAITADFSITGEPTGWRNQTYIWMQRSGP